MTAPHGTTARYNGDLRCRCQACRRAATRAAGLRRLRLLRGSPATVQAATVQAHIADLVEAGWSLTGVARAAGVGKTTVASVARRAPDALVHARAAAAILAVQHDPVSIEAFSVDASGTRLRLQALVARGWSYLELSRRLGLAYGNAVGKLASGTQLRVRPSTARAVRTLYDELWDVEPPPGVWADKTRRRAARSGWLPPLDLDDDRIDDPDYRPTPTITPHAPVVVEVAEIEHLVTGGADLHEVASRIGVQRDSICQACRRAGRYDLIERMRRNAAAVGRPA